MSIFGFPGGGGGLESPIPLDPTSARTLIVGPNLSGYGYTTIQGAINDAKRGDTIFVQPGTYDENLLVTTDYVTLVGSQLGGYGRPDVAPADGTSPALIVRAQGFVAKRMRFVAPDNGADADVVRQEGNGFKYDDCVFDGLLTNGATNALLRLKGNDTNDDLTASEGIVTNCLFRESEGFGIVFDTAEPTVGVGSTHNQIGPGNRFIDNAAADIATADTGPGTYSVRDTLIVGNYFMEPKNKATWIDLTTSNGGAAGDQTGCIAGNLFADDNIDTTAVAMVGTGFTFVGNYDTVGVQDGSGLD